MIALPLMVDGDSPGTAKCLILRPDPHIHCDQNKRDRGQKILETRSSRAAF